MRLNDNCTMVVLNKRDCDEIIVFHNGGMVNVNAIQLFFTNAQAKDVLEDLADALNVRLTYPDGSQNILDSDTITFAGEPQ